MRKDTIKLAACGLLVAGAVAGCASTGLSYRESPGRSYPSELRSMYAYAPYEPGTGQAPARPVFHGPARLTVAQVGEVAPPPSMIDTLSAERALFARVEGIPAGNDIGGPAQQTPQQHAPANATRVPSAMDWMLNYARQSGADYLLVYGGTMDTSEHQGALSMLDLTVVGAFIVPGHEVKATCRAAGVLIEVPTGHVVANVSAGRDDGRLTSAVAQSGDRIKLMSDLRDKVIADLAKDSIRACQADHTRPAPKT